MSVSDFLSLPQVFELPDVEILRNEEFSLTIDGISVQFLLPNGWGVSCVRSRFNYSGDNTAELAVVRRDPNAHGEFGDLDFTSGFADDVLGWQTPEELVSLLVNLNTLPGAVHAPVSPYAECGCISPCPDHSPAAVGAQDRSYWTNRYDVDTRKDDDE